MPRSLLRPPASEATLPLLERLVAELSADFEVASTPRDRAILAKELREAVKARDEAAQQVAPEQDLVSDLETRRRASS